MSVSRSILHSCDNRQRFTIQQMYNVKALINLKVWSQVIDLLHSLIFFYIGSSRSCSRFHTFLTNTKNKFSAFSCRSKFQLPHSLTVFDLCEMYAKPQYPYSQKNALMLCNGNFFHVLIRKAKSRCAVYVADLTTFFLLWFVYDKLRYLIMYEARSVLQSLRCIFSCQIGAELRHKFP